jgi:hypothetical protein
MKLRSFSLVLLFIATQLSAQELINLNPDKKGEPWYVGNLRKLTAEDYEKIAQTPKLKFPQYYTKKTLPDKIDNSLNKYFPPVFNQHDGSCGQASGIGYNFTYAIDFARDVEANTLQTQYPTHYTYNFLNDGASNGSFYFDGWEIINANGCPNVEVYGGTLWAKGIRGWMSGYSSYYSSMKNRVLETFTVNLTTPQGLETLKAWMNDQLNGSSVGGLANFSAGVSGSFTMTKLAAGTPKANLNVITHFDYEVNHAMTFVGYNDSIRYDFNSDGKYTNDKDINGDGTIDMRDWEIGGLIMVNSWGTSWGNSGKAFVPYKLLAEPSSNGGIESGLVYVIRAKASYEPKITLKASITHDSRNKLMITAGVSSNPAATRPDHILQLPLFNFQGGPYYMQGGTTDQDKSIEIGLDITPLLSFVNNSEEARFFLIVEEKDPNGTSIGKINSFSIIDYTNGSSETVYPYVNEPIQDNDTTFLSVNKTIAFDKVRISTETLPDVVAGLPYSYALNAENGTPPYNWNFIIDYNQKDSTSVFTSLTNNKLVPGNNDDDFVKLALPFEFPFYGKTYSQVLVTTDGSILFGDTFEYVRDISALTSSKAITVYGSDLMLYPDDGDGIWYFATKDSITVRWRTSKYGDATFNADFSVTLLPSGRIKFNYGSGISSSTDWVAGISNGDGISYSKASISGNNTVIPNQQIKFNQTGFPENMKIDKNGTVTFTTIKGGKDWSVTTRVTDFNKISSEKTLALHSVESLKITPDTLLFDSTAGPDPWQVGKDFSISNVCDESITLNKIDREGPGWIIDDSPMTYPYLLDPGESLSLKVILQSTFPKSSTLLGDTLNITTNYVTYPLSVIIDPSIFTKSVYSVVFNIHNSNGAIEGAIITIDNVTNSITTDNQGHASVSLPNGIYNYYISFKSYLPISGKFEIKSLGKTVDLFLSTVGVESTLDAAINVYPNPFSNELIITGLTGETKLSLCGLSGNTLIMKQSSGTQETIDTKNLPGGIYMLTIENEKGQKIVRKVIKR